MNFLRKLIEVEQPRIQYKTVNYDKSLRRQILAGEHYVFLRYLSAYVGPANRFDGKFHLCTYANGKLSHDSELGFIEFQSVVSPSFFKSIEPQNLENVLMFNRKIFGPVPFFGEMEFDVGLVSVLSLIHI